MSCCVCFMCYMVRLRVRACVLRYLSFFCNGFERKAACVDVWATACMARLLYLAPCTPREAREDDIERACV